MDNLPDFEVNPVIFLNVLAEKERRLEELEQELKDGKDQVIPAEVRERINALDELYMPFIVEVTDEINRLRSEITANVLKLGETCKGKELMAVYMKGRVTWDGKLLDGMMALIPELEKARKVGEPSVTFRKVK